MWITITLLFLVIAVRLVHLIRVRDSSVWERSVLAVLLAWGIPGIVWLMHSKQPEARLFLEHLQNFSPLLGAGIGSIIGQAVVGFLKKRRERMSTNV